MDKKGFVDFWLTWTGVVMSGINCSVELSGPGGRGEGGVEILELGRDKRASLRVHFMPRDSFDEWLSVLVG